MNKDIEPLKKRAGRPRIELTEAQYKVMRLLIAGATPPEQIAECLGISHATLKRDSKYKEYRRSAKLEMKAACIGAIARGVQNNEPWAVCFWLKTQYPEQFSEKQRIEIDQKLQAKYLSYEPLPLDEWMKEFGGAAPMVPTARTTDSVN